MPQWVVNILSAFGGAIVALVGKEMVDWWKQPRLEIDLKAKEKSNPYITDNNDFVNAAKGDSRETYRIKYLRLKVKNIGRRAALNCSAKIEITHAGKTRIYSDSKILHWSRHHELIYTKGLDVGSPVINTPQDIEKIYSPVDINSKDFELLEVLRMRYHYSGSVSPDLPSELTSASVDAIALIFQKDVEYSIKVSVFSYNAKPVSKSFRIKWNGTVDGFNSDIVLN